MKQMLIAGKTAKVEQFTPMMKKILYNALFIKPAHSSSKLKCEFMGQIWCTQM